MKRYSLLFSILSMALWIWSCDPFREDPIDLGPSPEAPQLSVEILPNDPNRVVVHDLSEGFFQRLWEMPNGEPAASTKATDTVFYRKAGVYTITLHASKIGGSGTSFATAQVTITQDASIGCNPKLALLTGDCGQDGKCWTFTHSPGAVAVGPTYGSAQWYSSPTNGLQAEQYDDSFCFYFDDAAFVYANNGATVNPWAGYAPVPYDPPAGTWSFREGTGQNGVDQIELSDGHFMGVWDSHKLLDIITLTETQLVVRARQADANGNPLAEGWFELRFEAR